MQHRGNLMKQPSRTRPAKKHVILFLAANPHDTGRLALDQEARSIHLELKRSGHRDRFDFVTWWAAEPLDLLRELRELKPAVVHFSGHGSGGSAGTANAAEGRDIGAPAAPGGAPSGLYFHSATGGAQVVSPEAIAQAFGSVDAGIRLVVLNACFTEPVAEALLAHVDCVVGMRSAIRDDVARSFAIRPNEILVAPAAAECGAARGSSRSSNADDCPGASSPPAAEPSARPRALRKPSRVKWGST
jgi:hypothetical protein